MSGIAGIIRFDGGPVKQGLFEKMTAAMPYRGRTASIIGSAARSRLASVIMRTTPKSLDERQPLTNEDESLVLVIEGWLSNGAE